MLTAKSAIRTMSFMIFATLMAKVLGMLRDILLAGYYGTGPEAVAFLAASRIPLLFFDIGLGAAISSTFIPVFNGYLEGGKQKEAITFSNYFVNIVLLLTGLITLLGAVFARQLVGFIAPGLDEQTYLLTVKLVRILFPMIIFTGVAFSFVGILQSLNEFNVPASISLVSNAIIIIYFVFLNKIFGIYGLAVTMLLAWSAQVVVQIPSLIKKGYTYRPILNIRSEGIRQVSLLALPILISTWIQPINTMVNLRLASYLNEGEAVAALDYANKLYIIIVGVFTYALTNLIFPSLSRMSAGDDQEKFAKLMNTALKSVIFFITPLMTGFIILRVPLIKLIYERGAFDASSTQLTSTALLFYSIGMVGFAVHEIINKGFYALHDASTPMKIAMGGIVLNIALSFTFVRFLGSGIGGLALAASIASIVIAITLLGAIQRKMRGIVNRHMVFYLLKVLIAAGVMGIIVFAVHDVLDGQLGDSLLEKVLRLGIPAVTGVFSYAVLTFLLKMEEARMVSEWINNKLRGV